MTDPDAPPPVQPAHQASSPFHGPDAALNGATAPQAAPAADDGTELREAVQEIQTAVGVIQVQLAIALALALLSLSILTYSLKQGRPPV